MALTFHCSVTFLMSSSLGNTTDFCLVIGGPFAGSDAYDIIDQT